MLNHSAWKCGRCGWNLNSVVQSPLHSMILSLSTCTFTWAATWTTDSLFFVLFLRWHLLHIPFCSFSNMLTPHELLSTYNSEVFEDHFMTPCRMTPMDTLCTSCKSRGIVILYMLVWCYARGLLHPCQPRGEVEFLRDDLVVSISCSSTHFSLSNWLVMFVSLEEVASVAYYIYSSCCRSYSMVICWWRKLLLPFSCANDVPIITFTWLLHDGSKSYS